MSRRQDAAPPSGGGTEREYEVLQDLPSFGLERGDFIVASDEAVTVHKRFPRLTLERLLRHYPGAVWPPQPGVYAAAEAALRLSDPERKPTLAPHLSVIRGGAS